MGKVAPDKLKRAIFLAFLLIVFGIGKDVLAVLFYRNQLPPELRTMAILADQWLGRIVILIVLVYFLFRFWRTSDLKNRIDTEKRQAEKELNLTVERWQGLIDLLPNYIYEMDRNMTITFANRAAYRAFGYDELEVREGVHALKLVHSQDQERAIRNTQSVFGIGEYRGPNEYRLLTKDGREITAIVESRPRYENGKIQSVLSCVTDITERKQAEAALRESERRYRALFETSPDAIFLVELGADFDYWPIIDCNVVASRINGYEREEIIGCDAGILAERPPSPDQRRRFLNRLRRDKSCSWEMKIRKKDGDVYSVEICDSLLELSGKEYMLIVSRDITRRKQAEEILLESEAKYRTLFDSSVLGILLVDIEAAENWKIVDCNEAVCAMNGYTREELLNQPLDILNMTVSGVDERLEKLAKIHRDKYTTDEYLHRHKDGTIFPIESTSSLITIGGRRYILGMDRDISQQKDAERALRESEGKYRSLVESAEVAIYTVNGVGEFIFMNRVALQSLGWTPENMKGKTVWDAFPPEYAELQMAGVRRAIGTGKSRTFENRTIIQGEPRWYRTSIQRVEEGRGPSLALIIAYDITRQKQAEAELAAEKERLAVTLSSIGEGVIATDVEGNVVLVNKCAEELTGWLEMEALGRPIREILRTQSGVQDGLSGPIGDIIEDVTLIARNGSERKIIENGAAIRDAEGKALGMVFVIRDITRQRKNEQELLKIQKLESLGVLAGGIAHDFNNIMTSLLLNVQLCKILSAQRADIDKHMTDMEKAIMRATNLTGQLLTFAKGGAPVKKRLLLDEVVRETVEFSLHGLQSKCEFSIEENLPLVEADEGQLCQVMNNLVLNADQSMPNGGVITVGIQKIRVDSGRILPLNPGNYVRIAVADRGIGIAKENLTRIFDPYFTTKRGGNGLGLASAYSIVKGHNGYIDVESAEGKGTVFSIYLPAMEENRPNIAKEGEDAKQGGGRILLMDDDEAIRVVVGEALNKSGFETVVTSNGEEAIRQFHQARDGGRAFDVLVLDLTIPGGIGGLEVLEKLKVTDPAIKAIVASGYSNSPVMANYQRFGFSGVMTKPFKIESLVQTINQIMEKRAAGA